MKIVYSEHAQRRMRQRSITELEVEHILQSHWLLRKLGDERKEVVGRINNRTIRIIFVETENYIKIVTLM